MISTFDKGVVRFGKPDTRERFCKLVERRIDRYNGFIDKWVRNPSAEADILSVKYEDLTQDSRTWLKKTIMHFSPREEIDETRIDGIVSETPKITYENGRMVRHSTSGVKGTRRVEDFKYYDSEWFAELAEMTRIDGDRKERKTA